MTREKAIRNITALNAICGQKKFYNKQFKRALDTAIEVLEAEPCEDAISRQAAIKSIVWCVSDIERIKKLPSVIPSKSIGRWVEHEDAMGDTYYDCSCCGESWSTIDGNPWNNGMKYCPNCGAKMESEGEK